MGLLLWDFVKAGSFTNAILGAGLQLSPTKRVFTRLGAGLGRLSSSSDSKMGTADKFGGAGQLGLGVEFFQMQHLAFDGELTTTVNKIVGDSSAILNWSLLIGAQWF